MRRVLDRNGRLALSVWNNVGIYNTAEADFSDVEAPNAPYLGQSGASAH